MLPAAATVPDSGGRSHEVVELSDEPLGNEGRHEGAELADELLDSRDGVFQPTSGAVTLTPLCLFRGLEVVTGGARCGWVPGRVESSEGFDHGARRCGWVLVSSAGVDHERSIHV